MNRIAWGLLAALALLLVANAGPYLGGGDDFAFYADKGELASRGPWRITFLAHVAGGLACLGTGLALRFLRNPAAHRAVGRVYAVAVLGWAGPSGLYLAFHAKGGIPGRLCFLLLAAAWIWTTARGVQAILARRTTEHVAWMNRSWGYALSAVFFRVFHVALYGSGLGNEANYVISLWLSLAASVVAGELPLLGPAPDPKEVTA